MTDNRTTFEVDRTDGFHRFSLKTQSQATRVLCHLIDQGSDGATALEISSWALRMSEYIRRLRDDYGLAIDTVREAHRDRWGNESWHGRYVLRDKVRIVSDGAVAA